MNQTLSFDEKYAAIGQQDSRYEGAFITGVTSTGIFCRPSCRARRPLPKNIIFYDTSQQAIQAGFRPCKICKPMDLEGEAPEHVKSIIKELQADPYLKIKDWDLRQRGVEPSQIRRWFQKNHNMTFHSYQRMMRINQAYNQIKGGNSVTNAAFGIGYESLSGFNDGYKKIFGQTATNGQAKAVINVIRFTTPLGPMFACATKNGLCLLEFTDRRMLETEFKDLCQRFNAVILPSLAQQENEHLDQTQTQLSQYFAGERQEFDLEMDFAGTEFQQSVWVGLQDIKYGETRSYKQQAAFLNRPKAVRAVANANGMNKISIIIPCHRVIGSDGNLTGYGGGLARKKWLIEHEQTLK
ncbi:MAG: methylated-DNA--[protein]-cysteine S-methyltransferase [Rhizobiales bacterium]|nr:methylated-DNA--[protein]-cysteine S-methyltransferase [Hyphomicrobiales bacterium]NRB15716.1 methylated-DNA--[protein]-cysteine S-methyltransferase [Hyphomicrobiales bacterium]